VKAGPPVGPCGEWYSPGPGEGSGLSAAGGLPFSVYAGPLGPVLRLGGGGQCEHATSSVNGQSGVEGCAGAAALLCGVQ
jgi:hypothetical protein